MDTESKSKAMCGIWVDGEGAAHLSWESGDGPRRVETVRFHPFMWAREGAEHALPDAVRVETLRGEGVFNRLLTFGEIDDYQAFLKENRRDGSIDWIRLLETQFLMQTQQRVFGEMNFGNLRRMQLDIETACSVEGGFSDAKRKEDRVLAIGVRCGEREELIVLESRDDEGERVVLNRLNEIFADWDPDVIEGHNIFKFDLEYLRRRAQRLKVSCLWGRFGQKATFRNSRLRVAERWIDYPRCDLAGRAVVDTYLLIQIYDITTRELMSYGLKDVARYLGVTPEDGEGRTYIEGSQIQVMFDEDRERFLEYLSDDLRETEGIANLLLPTYFEQTKAFPTTLQEACLRGTANKVDLVFQEEYYHRKAACPMAGEIGGFAGGYTASFKEGVYKDVLHFDVASLYPSILLMLDRNPSKDTEGVFIPMLKKLRTYRLKYKTLARETTDASLAAEYNARQTSYKILINSFYGYLGFGAARFGDAELAADVTARGRELLKKLIAFFEGEEGCEPLEADTDGIYVATNVYYDREDELLKKAQAVLPEGIELEYDGKYVSMFSYKSKNYALYDGSKVVIRGSALRSRGIEPYLKKLTLNLIRFLVGASDDDPAAEAEGFEKRIKEADVEIGEIAKSEILSQSPQKYKEKIDAGGKPRRASAEAALQMSGDVNLGDRVSYFIGHRASGEKADWQRAKPVELYDKDGLPYDPKYYVKKLNDWRNRYAVFYPKLLESSDQGMLF